MIPKPNIKGNFPLLQRNFFCFFNLHDIYRETKKKIEPSRNQQEWQEWRFLKRKEYNKYIIQKWPEILGGSKTQIHRLHRLPRLRIFLKNRRSFISFWFTFLKKTIQFNQFIFHEYTWYSDTFFHKLICCASRVCPELAVRTLPGVPIDSNIIKHRLDG